MPIIKIDLSAPQAIPSDRKLKIARTIAGLSASILGKKAELTAVQITEISGEDWLVGGDTLAAQKLASFFVEIRVTDETNTKAEKAAFIEEVFTALAGLLGPVSPVSYVHVADARADAWGYGGLSQEFRHIAGELEKRQMAELSGQAIARWGIR